MDPKRIVFMVILLIVLVNVSSSRKSDNSTRIQKKTHRRGSRLSKVHRKTTLVKKYRSTKHKVDNLNKSNGEIYQSKNIEDILNSFTDRTHEGEINDMARNIAEESDATHIKRLNREYINDNSESTTVENDTTDPTYTAEETSPQPQKQRLRKTKRRMKKKQNKRYKAQFKYSKLKTKRVSVKRKPNTDIPDNAEVIIDELKEIYPKTTPARTKKEKRKKGNKIRKLNKTVSRNAKYSTRHWEESDNRKQNVGRTKSEKQKRKPMLKHPKNIKDYFESESEEMEKESKQTPKPNHERTEIINLTPMPRHKKYNPEFRYIRIDSEPMNYANMHYRNKDMDEYDEADESKSISKDSKEMDSDEKKATNWAETYKLTHDNDNDSNSDDNEGETSETNEEKSKETQESDRDHLKRRRTAEENWEDIKFEKIKYIQKINGYNNLSNSNVTENKLHKVKILRNKNYPKNTKSHLDVTQNRLAPSSHNSMDNIDVSQEKMSTEITTPENNIVKITFKEDRAEKYDPESHYNKKYQRMMNKILKRRSTRAIVTPITYTKEVEQNYKVTPKRSRQYETIHKDIFVDKSTVMPTLPMDESKGRHDPVIKYNTGKISEDGIKEEGIPSSSSTRKNIPDMVKDRLAPVLQYSRQDGSKPKETYMKRSTIHESVRVVKILHGRHRTKKKEHHTTIIAIARPDETTTVDNYDEITGDSETETEKKPSYDVHEDIMDVPDTRQRPGPIVPDYVISPNQKIIFKPKLRNRFIPLNPVLPPADNKNNENAIVNVVQGVKDYFTIIGRGLINSVKGIFKD